MKETISAWIRVLFKTGASALVGWLIAIGVEVPADLELTLIALFAGLANVVLNVIATWLLARTWMPEFLRSLILFLWAPPSYEQAQA